MHWFIGRLEDTEGGGDRLIDSRGNELDVNCIAPVATAIGVECAGGKDDPVGLPRRNLESPVPVGQELLANGGDVLERRLPVNCSARYKHDRVIRAQ